MPGRPVPPLPLQSHEAPVVTVFILRRLVTMLITLWFIISITFILMHLIPGDPFISEARLPETVLANLRAYYGTDRSPVEQYLRYLAGLARLDLGPSFTSTTQGVGEQIAQGFPASARLGLQALAIALLGGAALGILAAIRPGGFVDGGAMLLATAGIAVPSFVLAPILINVLAVRMGWFPVAAWGTWKHTVLPSLALSATPLAFIARLMRASLLDVLGQDYLRTARAKGLTPALVLFRHAMRNALIPLVTVLGPLAAGVLTGSFVIEQIFGVPGTGRMLVRAIFERNYPVILGATVYYSAILLLFNLLVDLAYGLIDPRIKLARSNA